MKLIIAAALAALAAETSACKWFIPCTCYVGPNCAGPVVTDPWDTVQKCSVGGVGSNGVCGMNGGIQSEGGDGGGSWACVDGTTNWCTTATVRNGNRLTVTRFEVGNPSNTDTQTVMLTCAGGEFGEPHIKTWNGTWYDWHGECDSVLVHAPDFGYGVGLDIHTRTKIRYDYSFIETVAIKIGDEILEISGYGEYMLNGVSSADFAGPALKDYPVTYDMKNKIDHEYTVDLGEGVNIIVKTHKDIVSVDVGVVHVTEGNAFIQWFINSAGMMGSFVTGELLARDGETVINDLLEFGQEWQVLDTEPKLFQSEDRHPQHPHKCLLPSPAAQETRRRLGATISMEAAEEACSMWKEDAKERCMFDVLATGDLGMATAGAF